MLTQSDDGSEDENGEDEDSDDLPAKERREELLMMQSRYLRSIFENDIRKSGTLYSLEAPAEMEKFLPEMT